MIRYPKFLLCLALFSLLNIHVFAQDEDEKRGFKKENLFTGGSLSLSFFNQSFLIGGNPEFGYSLGKWADLGVVINYTYTSYRDYSAFNDRLRQYVYGAGLFARLYPVRFVFGQAQIEHNEIRLKYKPPPNSGMVGDTYSQSAASLLIGGGIATTRDPEFKKAYGYLALLFDVGNSVYSPYIDEAGRSLPIIRAGVHIPLFQGH